MNRRDFKIILLDMPVDDETKKINVYGYARKSPDDEKKTDTSIDNQIRLIENICKQNLKF